VEVFVVSVTICVVFEVNVVADFVEVGGTLEIVVIVVFGVVN
jgi:hypothetical protein